MDSDHRPKVFCHRCDRFFSDFHALDQHERDSTVHNKCYTCQLDFDTPVGLKEHYVQSPRHSFCQYCRIHFDDDEDLHQRFQDECSPTNMDCRNITANHDATVSGNTRIEDPTVGMFVSSQAAFIVSKSLTGHLQEPVNMNVVFVVAQSYATPVPRLISVTVILGERIYCKTLWE